MKFKKKPVVVEAVQVAVCNQAEIRDFMGDSDNGRNYQFFPSMCEVKIKTLEGVMTANLDDWIIKGVNGEFYTCKHDIFKKTYEPVEGQENE